MRKPCAVCGSTEPRAMCFGGLPYCSGRCEDEWKAREAAKRRHPSRPRRKKAGEGS